MSRNDDIAREFGTKKFTIEEIEKAMKAAHLLLLQNPSNSEAVISELTKENTFVEGQVLFDGAFDDSAGEFFAYYNDSNIENCRILSPSECGPHVVAMLEALKKIQSLMPTPGYSGVVSGTVRSALSNLPENWK